MTKGSKPELYPTTSDVSSFMKDLDFKWSNEAQIYYCKYDYTHITDAVAQRLYRKLIGNKPNT